VSLNLAQPVHTYRQVSSGRSARSLISRCSNLGFIDIKSAPICYSVTMSLASFIINNNNTHSCH